jgi:hypothetical protein
MTWWSPGRKDRDFQLVMVWIVCLLPSWIAPYVHIVKFAEVALIATPDGSVISLWAALFCVENHARKTGACRPMTPS